MSDPAVTAYLTKLLCSYGGRLERNQLGDILDLPEEQIEQILQNEPLKFPQSYQLILARNPLRICTKYLYPKEEEGKEKCPKLHLCRDYLRSLCPPNRRPRCRFSHDVFSDHNHAVLKTHELSGLNEEEIKILLFQNDHQLLPENCRKYMRNNCEQGEDCTRLHVCFYFMRGECNNCACKQSHNLLESKALLTCSWLSQESIQNFQMLCVLKHNERQQAPREEPRNEEFRGVSGKSQGSGRRRPRDRRRGRPQDLMKDRSKGRRNNGARIFRQSGGRQPPQRTRGQHLEYEYSEMSDDENNYDDRNSETRIDSLMEEWFSPNTASTYAPEFPSAPFNNPNTASVAPILSRKSDQPQTHAPYRDTEQTRTEVSHQVGDFNSLNSSMISLRKEASLHQPTVPTAPNKPTLKSGPSTTSPRPLTSSTFISSAYGDQSTQLKPLNGSARLPSPPTVSSTSAFPSNKLRNSSIDASFRPEPIISAKPSLVFSKSEKRSSPSTPNQAPVKKVGEKVCSSVAEPANGLTSESPLIAKPKLAVIQQPKSDVIHLKPKPTSRNESKSHQSTNILCATQQKWPPVYQQSDNRQPSQRTRSQHLEDEYNKSDGENDYDKTRLDSLMDEWFSPNTASTYAHEFPSAPFNIPNTASVALIPSHKSDQSPTTEQTRTEVSRQVGYSNSLNTPMIPPRTGAPLHQPTVPTVPKKPTLKSTASPRPLTTLSTLINPSSGDPSTQPKPLTRSVRLPGPPTVSSTSLSLTSESPSIAKPKPAVSAVASHLESSSRLSSNSDFSSVPFRDYTRTAIIKPEAASVIQQPKSDVIHLKPKPTSPKESKFQESTNNLCATLQKCDKTLDELATWTKNGKPNTKKVSSSIPSSEPKAVYLSNLTKTVPFAAESPKDILSCQKIKQMTDHCRTESVVHRSPSFPDDDKLKMTSGSKKSDAINVRQRKADSTLKVVKYPPTWDIKAEPEAGYQNILLPETCDEFRNVTKMFNKTVRGHKVQKVWRVQNPALWSAYQRQKDQMKEKNSGINVQECQLFHGTDSANITTICSDNFDWSVCGTNSILYGRGNYFARDASYAHRFSPANPAGIKTMFVARVVVGDYVKGEPAMRHPPQKHRSTESYDCCVNSLTSPSIFVVFENSQAYPEYILEYKREPKSACNIS